MSNISFVFDEFAKNMIASLEEAKNSDNPILPWQQPYGRYNTPQNPVTKSVYRGVNVMNLGMAPFSSPYWLTFANIKNIGGRIKPEENKRYRHVIFSKRYTPKSEKEVEEDKKPKSKFVFQYTLVWNTDQLEGWDSDKLKLPEIPTEEFNPIEEAEAVVSGYKNAPKVLPNSTQIPFYRPSEDAVFMPDKRSFASPDDYYCTLFHELGHSTGHESRLAREGIMKVSKMETHRYSFEELIAEFCAAGICGYTGISNNTIDNSLAYINYWSNTVKNDQDSFIKAVSHAQKAYDLILGREINAYQD